MNRLLFASNKPLRRHLALAGVVIFLSACASKTALHDQERARYEELENELIQTQQAEERQRKSDYRVSELQQRIDSDSSKAEISRQGVYVESESADVIANGNLQSPSVLNRSPKVVADQISDESDSPVWQLQKYPDPVSGLSMCAAVSRTVVASNGPLETKVNIIVSSNATILRTDAVFDTEARETGYRIDAGFPIPFDRFVNELTAIVEKNHTRLSEAMLAGTTIAVAFTYSPQLSSENTHVVELPLDSFADAWSGVAQCNEQKQQDATSYKDEPIDS